MKQRLLCSMLLALCFFGTQAAVPGAYDVCDDGLTLSVTNHGDQQRQEVVEVDYATVCRKLGVNMATPIVVRNSVGQEQVYQITYDGLLLLEVMVQPHSTANYTVNRGVPSKFKSSVKGKVYPERADDLTWENDRGIYRMYGPALQRSGEKAYGTDVWVKNTPELVVDERYRLHILGVAQRDSLNRIGKKKDANDIYMKTSFHHDHGYGLDCYGVGATLGCGTPALLRSGQLQFPYCWQKCDIRDNGPLRFTVALTYGKTADGITEYRLVRLDKGSHFNRITVSYDGISQPTGLAAGVVIHDDKNPLLGKNYVLYADPTENPQANQSQIYVGTLFPEGIDETVSWGESPRHGLGIIRQYKKPYTYYFGSAWSGYDVRTFAQWQQTAEEYLYNLSNPLTIQLQ